MLVRKAGKQLVGRTARTSSSASTRSPHNAKLRVENGQEIRAGDAITDGPINPQEYLETRGRDAVQRYLVKEVQKVYRSQGVTINDKHIEIIVRQMLRKVRMDQPGDTRACCRSSSSIASTSRRSTTGSWPRAASRRRPRPSCWASPRRRSTPSSFLAAASFQETTRVLTEAAINGSKDHLLGLKENVIIGKLIPAGTGAPAAVAARREEERRRAAEALAGGELPEGFGEEYNPLLEEAMETLPTGEDFNPLLAEAMAGDKDEDLGPTPSWKGRAPATTWATRASSRTTTPSPPSPPSPGNSTAPPARQAVPGSSRPLERPWQSPRPLFVATPALRGSIGRPSLPRPP